jgi:hypothetical protein
MFADAIKGNSNKQPEATKDHASNESVKKLSALARFLPGLTPLFKHLGISESQSHPESPFSASPGAPPSPRFCSCG